MPNIDVSAVLHPKLMLFQQLFPAEKIITVIENQGMEHYILEINDTWICKVAKNSDHGLAVENKVLQFLQGKLQTTIPVVVHYEPGFLVYRKIVGQELSVENYAHLTQAQKTKLTGDIAIFLQELHALDLAEVMALGLDCCNWPWCAQQLISQADLITDRVMQQLFENFIPRYLGLKPEYAPVLIHNDLIIRNIIVDTKTGDLNGIIDFTDVAIGDRYLDLRLRWNSIPELVENVAIEYARLTSIKLELERIYIYYLATEFSRYLQLMQACETGKLTEVEARIIFAANRIRQCPKL